MRVVNASTLIHLSRLSLLELLRESGQGSEVIVPSAVFDEVMFGARHDSSASLVQAAAGAWLRVVPTPPPNASINSRRIDAGEIAVLSVALEMPGASVVLDDRAARAEADRLQRHGAAEAGATDRDIRRCEINCRLSLRERASFSRRENNFPISYFAQFVRSGGQAYESCGGATGSSSTRNGGLSGCSRRSRGSATL